jgi:hypothetical protein
MVTTQNLELLRRNNFGLRVLNRLITTDILSAEIRRYDPLDALNVSQKVRAMAGLTEAVDQVLDVYNTVLNGWAKNQQDSIGDSLAFSAYLRRLSDDVYRFRSREEHIRELQDELNLIRSRLTWRLYERIHRIAFIHSIYLRMINPIRRLHAGKKGK